MVYIKVGLVRVPILFFTLLTFKYLPYYIYCQVFYTTYKYLTLNKTPLILAKHFGIAGF